MYFLHHRKESPIKVTNLVARKYKNLFSNRPKKIIFAMDAGESFRKQIYPEYKAHRREKEKNFSKVDKERLKKFNKLYQKIPDYLRLFGNVIQVQSIEADDIASAFCAGIDTSVTPIVLLTSDEDWTKFMKDGVYYAHVNRDVVYTVDDIEAVYGFKPSWKVHLDSVTGVHKENVEGISNFGKTRALNWFKSVDGDVERFLESVQEIVNLGKYGAKIPPQFSSVKEMYEFNKVLFQPMTFADFDQEHKSIMMKQFSETPPKEVDAIITGSMKYLDTIYYPTDDEIFVYNLREH